MKKFLFLFIIGLVFCACSPQEESSNSPSSSPTAEIDKNTVFSFDINTLSSGCEHSSLMICAINASIKCTINPNFEECAKQKAYMPNFIFMEDESLKRPTSQSYKITKIKPISDGSIEVYTQSTCNGNWFGLCNGNIIYVMDYQNNKWHVKDIYAVEF